jgi:hypothetical protein
MEYVSSPPSNLEKDATTLNKHKNLGFRGQILRKPQRYGPTVAYRRRPSRTENPKTTFKKEKLSATRKSATRKRDVFEGSTVSVSTDFLRKKSDFFWRTFLSNFFLVEQQAGFLC